ncbi:MAG: hypothetical protein GXX83_10740 [Gaiellales bacterium]|nr:hypothetical protein [Gaiellales bacterium]
MRRFALTMALLVAAVCACLAAGCGATAAVAGMGIAMGGTASVSASATPTSAVWDASAENLADGCSLSISEDSLTIETDGLGAVLAVNGGEATLSNADIVTTGVASIPLAVDRGGAGITATDCRVVSSGGESPCLYSTGDMVIQGGVYEAMVSEAAVVEGDGSLMVAEAALSSKSNDGAVLLFSTATDGTTTALGSFTMEGGALVYADRHGSLFTVSNCTCVISLSKVDMAALSGQLLTAAAGEWGAPGSNGGHAVLHADNQQLAGVLSADALSTLDMSLQNGSSLSGSINPTGMAAEAHLTLDASSTWKVSEDSHLTSLTLIDVEPGDTIANIIGCGHIVTYDPDCPASSALGGRTYSLNGGGCLVPAVQQEPTTPISREEDR